MKKYILSLLLLISFLVQSQTPKKETVYLMFDITSNEKCSVENEEGNTIKVNKFRNNNNKFYICKEIFSLKKTVKLIHVILILKIK